MHYSGHDFNEAKCLKMGREREREKEWEENFRMIKAKIQKAFFNHNNHFNNLKNIKTLI